MKALDRVVNVALLVAAGGALATGVLALDRHLDLGIFLHASPTNRVTDWRVYGDEGHRTGPKDAQVSIVVFSDYECKYCQMLNDVLHALGAQHPDQVSITFRHFPLQVYSWDAALAAECAGAQGRFMAYHDLLFSKRDSIGTLSWTAFASQAAVSDSADFNRCIADSVFESRLKEDQEAARSLGGRGTPLILINDRVYQGAPSKETLEDRIAHAIDESRRE